jgi:copper chaperone CopZ
MTTRLRSAAIGLTFLLVLFPAPARAQVEEVKITVDGLTCNLCAAGLDRSLRKVDGVTGVKVTLATQVATMRLKPGVRVAPDQLRAAVERAGQSLVGVEVRLRGTLQRSERQYQLRAPELPQVFALRDDARLQALAGKTVRLRGRVRPAGAPGFELEVVDVTP